MEQKSKCRYIFWLFIAILQILTEKCKTEKWNGCYDFEYKPMNSTNYCYKLTEPMKALDAWGYCSTVELITSSHLKEFKEELKTNGIWISRETYTYFHENSSASPQNHPLQICYALDNELNPVMEDCYGKELTQVCWREKFSARSLNASSPCGIEEAVALPPFPGCYKEAPSGTCPPGVDLRLRARPVGASGEMRVVEIEERGRRFIKEDDTIENATLFCRVKDHKDIPNARLQLRNNETAGDLTLWVGNPGRAMWPPQCHSGYVVNESDLTAVPVKVNDTNLPYFFCFVRDIFDQTAILSNRVFSNSRQLYETCQKNESKEMNLEELLNENSVCTRCLRKALSLCVPTDNCERNCGDEGCKNILERQTNLERMFPRRVADWSEDSDCGARALWWLTEGEGDCNGDGIEDCDDTLARLLNPSCHPSAPDMRSLPVGEEYWRCRTNWTAELSRDTAKNSPGTSFCVKSLHEGTDHFPLLVDFIPTYESKYLDCIAKDFIPEDSLTELNRLLNHNKTLSSNIMEVVASNISSLMKLNEKELERAQNVANVSSLPELIDKVLLLAPQGTTITRDNVLLSKASGDIIGVKVLSIERSPGDETDNGKFRVQKNITEENEIQKVLDKLEAAVVIPNRPKDTSIVTVISTGSAAFVSSERKNSLNLGVYDNRAISPNNLTPATNQPSNRESDNHTHTLHPRRKPDVAIEHGCINSLVVGVSLQKNGVYESLPEGGKVRIIFRTNIFLLPGQSKRCVYYNPNEGIWKSDGCRLLSNADHPNLDTCECDHLTHFAELVTDGNFITDTHAQVLRSLSVFSCCVSLVGLGGVIAAGILDKKWRKKSENKVLVNLCVAVAASMVVFLKSALSLKESRTNWCEVPSAQCRAAGVLLHYLVLASFCWMLVAATTHYLRLTTYTGVSHYSNFVLKASLVGWGAPLVPVGALLATHADAYAGKSRDFCYPSGAAFYCAVLAPVCLVLALNACLFGAVLRRLFPQCCAGAAGAGNMGAGPALTRWGVSERRLQVRMALVCVAFTFLFGLTWYLGLLSYHLGPAYIFCFAQALQGPALFVFFVLGEENVRRKLLSYFRRIKKSETSSTMELKMCPNESSAPCTESGEQENSRNQTIPPKENVQISREETEPSSDHGQRSILPMRPPKNQTNPFENQAEASINQVLPYRNRTQPLIPPLPPLKHRTQTSRDQTQTSKDQTQTSRNQTQTSRDQTQTSRDQTQKSKDQTQTSRNQTQTSRDQTQTSRNQTQTSRDQTQASRDQTQASRDQTQTSRDQTQTSRDQTQTSRARTQTSRDQTHPLGDQTLLLRNRTQQPNVQIQPPNVQPGYALLANCAVPFRKLKTSRFPNFFR